MKVLIIEDETKTASYLQKGLTELGFIADVVDNGLDGLFQAQGVAYNLIILDVMLPKLDGWAVIEKYREFNQSVPVLFLTARDDVNDRVKGLKLGADDYLIKPFAFSELLARIHTLLRRSKNQNTPNQIIIADLIIDFESIRVTREGRRLDLTPKEFVLLSLFTRNQGKILSRTTIAESVWDMNFDSDTNIVDVAVRRLRAKVDDPYKKRFIHTVRGLGYIFEER